MNIENILFLTLGALLGFIPSFVSKRQLKLVTSVLVCVLVFIGGYATGTYSQANLIQDQDLLLPSKTVAKIESLQAGSTVDQTLDRVFGSVTGLPSDYTIWFYVKINDKYFLRRISALSDKTWQVTDVTIGIANQTGEKFELGIMAANAEADSQLSKSSNSVFYLPKGIKVLNTISVTRK